MSTALEVTFRGTKSSETFGLKRRILMMGRTSMIHRLTDFGLHKHELHLGSSSEITQHACIFEQAAGIFTYRRGVGLGAKWSEATRLTSQGMGISEKEEALLIQSYTVV